jgi:GrpB-like predicted nucleotidyltransferase (UPF0157 family)
VVEVELVGGVEKRELIIQTYDPAWPRQYADHEACIHKALGGSAIRVEHIGSISVPGLGAKPIVDILVIVRDITAEEDYLAPLLAAGYEPRVREPGHRMVRTAAGDVHIHMLEPEHPAVDDYLLLRDHLRVNRANRELYESTKQELTARDWPDMNAYAEAKTEVIEAIMSRARAQMWPRARSGSRNGLTWFTVRAAARMDPNSARIWIHEAWKRRRLVWTGQRSP